MNPNGPPNQYKFKPGQSGNPSGRQPDPPDVRQLKKLNRGELEKIMNEVLQMSMTEMRAFTKNENNNGMKFTLVRIMMKAAVDGDGNRVEFFLRRLLGPVPTVLSDPNGDPVSFVGLVKLARDRKAGG